jgi:O-antigen/teichoic acid export membrane protein
MLISQTVLGFGVVAVLSRLLGAEAFGEYAVILTVASVFQLIAAFPVESGIPKFLAEANQQSRSEVKAYYAAGLLTRLAASLLALLVAGALARQLSGLYHIPHLTGAVLFASLYLCLLAPIASYHMACIQGMERPRRWATANVLTSLLIFPLALIGALGFSRWGQGGLMVLLAAGWLLAAAVAALLARGALGFLWSFADWSRLRLLVMFLLPMWVVPLFGFIARTVVRSWLAVKWGPVPLGQLEIALTLLAHLGTVYQASMIVLLPAWTRRYARQEGAALLQSYSTARGLLIGVAVVYGATLVFAGQWIVPAIFGREQVGAVPIARIIGLTMPVMIAGWVASTTNVIANRTATIAHANLIWFLLVVAIGLVLIPPLGAMGAALAWLGAYCVFSWFYISRARPFFREVERWTDTSPCVPPASHCD